MRGRLTKDKFGLTMPVTAAAFVEKPPYWRGATWYSFNYETDPELAAQIVPEQLTLTDPATARLIFAEYEWSTGGPYMEILQAIDVSHQGEQCVFFTQAAVSQSIPLMAGREGYGFPKKVGHISFVRHEDLVGMFYERPPGLRLITGVFRGISPVEPPPGNSIIKGITLRVILSPKPDVRYSLAELILGELEIRPKEIWVGEGNCTYSGLSELDPWDQLPVRKNLGCTRTNLDINLKGAAIIATL